MGDDPLVRFTLADAGGAAHLAWAEGASCALPLSVLQAGGLAPHLDAGGKLRLPARLEGMDPATAPALRLRAAFTDTPPLTSRLPLSYRLVPGWLRAGLASLLGRWKRKRADRWACFPGWPLDLSADLLADLVRGPSAAAPPGPAPVLLTHDLDSPEGLERLLKQFLPLEEAAGARSVDFVVPCAWPLDRGRLNEVKARGHEIGTHGYDHSNRTAYAPPAERRRRLEAGKAALDGYDVRGYRAPSLVRTAALLRDLAGLYRVDSSIPTAGGLFPTPNNGCASARPFPIEGIWEIPLSLPRDGSLRFLGYSPAEIAALWIDCAERVGRSGGVVVLLTHCEARFSGNGPMLAAYRTFLEHVVGSGRFRWSSPAEVLRAAGRDPVADQVHA
jgi:peptidoglycan/xylan/chitin deacetylase (PgdA/CDA1 family)